MACSPLRRGQLYCLTCCLLRQQRGLLGNEVNEPASTPPHGGPTTRRDTHYNLIYRDVPTSPSFCTHPVQRPARNQTGEDCGNDEPSGRPAAVMP